MSAQRDLLEKSLRRYRNSVGLQSAVMTGHLVAAMKIISTYAATGATAAELQKMADDAVADYEWCCALREQLAQEVDHVPPESAH